MAQARRRPTWDTSLLRQGGWRDNPDFVSIALRTGNYVACSKPTCYKVLGVGLTRPEAEKTARPCPDHGKS